jgi:CheY-like chemotaxis protein
VSESSTAILDPRPALVCIDEGPRRTAVTTALAELGYTPEVPTSGENALDRMRKQSFEVVVVDQAYEGSAPLDNPVLRGLGAMNMTVRRYMFVALVGSNLPTLDNTTAFSRSVNAVFSYEDLAQLAPILKRAIADNDAFYRVFREVLRAAGKR